MGSRQACSPAPAGLQPLRAAQEVEWQGVLTDTGVVRIILEAVSRSEHEMVADQRSGTKPVLWLLAICTLVGEVHQANDVERILVNR